jgi:regulator of sigma E protease
VLDGGHITMSLIEAIFGKPISPKLQEYATSAFAILLISFMVYVTYYDIDRISIFKSLFKEPGSVEQVESPEAP